MYRKKNRAAARRIAAAAQPSTPSTADSPSPPSSPTPPLTPTPPTPSTPVPGPLLSKFPLKVSNIPTHVEFHEVLAAFNRVLRPSDRPGQQWLKFTLQLSPAQPPQQNGGGGMIYLESEYEGKRLARLIGERDIMIENTIIYFARVDGSLTRATYVRTGFREPRIADSAIQKKKAALFALRHDVRIITVQFGILSRDGNGFSVEWEGDYDPDAPPVPGRRVVEIKPEAYLKFNEGRDDENPRSLQIEIGGHSQLTVFRITIPMNQISAMESAYDFGQPYVILTLDSPPSFETKDHHTESTGDDARDRRQAWQRIPALDPAHERVVGFASRALRLVFTRDETHLQNFIAMSAYSHLPRLAQSRRSQIIRANLFSQVNMERAERVERGLPWVIRFQLEALLRNCLLTASEIAQLDQQISRLTRISVSFAEQVLKLFVAIVPGIRTNNETVQSCLARAEHDCIQRGVDSKLSGPAPGTFRSRHVMVTPTSYQLEGPYSEQSNRVLRIYGPQFEECFLRIAFSDEGGNMFRQEYEVDNKGFVEARVGGILKEGIEIADRHFAFLAYSSSGLRQHSVWFVTPFNHPEYGSMDADIIRSKLGTFSKDIYCPARYGARISLAFSSTDPSITLKPDEIKKISDIITYTDEIFTDGKPKELLWTDGVGTISPDLADEIWSRLCQLRPHTTRKKKDIAPCAYQIRLGGFKGVISIDYKLKGQRVICLRDSMDKFDAPDSLGIEISEAFNSPSLMYLNRPLIMLLDTLGVKHSTFLKLQDDAIEVAQDALKFPDTSATLMKMYMLGDSYSLPHLMARFERFGLQKLHDHDPFIRSLLTYSLYHVKRELKYHSRIPVPDSWTLVGIADIHDFLEEGEIFACVQQTGKDPLWLEGPIMISRSPTVHPGDVQMVRGVGKPPDGSPYDIKLLTNCVIFATKGRRPLPSCLGGGDLDGDVYNLVLMPDLHPPEIDKPGAYEAGKRKTLERPSTIDDIADFVVDYIISDTLGLIGANQVRLADQRPLGMRDKDCLRLAELHSLAVDYPKTGTPVALRGIPKPPLKPDWCCSESANPNDGEYYESNRALGVLFRNVTLPPVEPPKDPEAVNQEVVVRAALHPRVKNILLRYAAPVVGKSEFAQLFHRYSYELKYQCVTHHLSQNPNARLKEEEVVIGTILNKTTHGAESRKRKNLMDRLTKQSKDLVRYIKNEVASSPDVPRELWLARSWTALEVAYEMVGKNVFGAKSFALIILSTVLDALDAIEEAERDEVDQAKDGIAKIDIAKSPVAKNGVVKNGTTKKAPIKKAPSKLQRRV